MEKVKKKLLFFCSKFGGGGAEMHFLRVMNEIPLDEFEVHLALTRRGGGYEEFLDSRIQRHYLSDSGSSTIALVKSIRPLWKLIQQLKPSHVISIMDRQNIAVARLKRKHKEKFQSKLILCCQVAPSKDLSSTRSGRFIAKRIERYYNAADKIVAISKGVKGDLVDNYGITIPVEVIYNAGWDDSIHARKDEPIDYTKAQFQFIAVGRLAPQKGFDILLNAIAELNIDQNFNCWILGEGPDRQALEDQANQLQIADKVSFLGFQKNPFAFMNRADAFVLSSRWEGFGNVIVEAMVCDCPVVSTDCDFGPGEIITHEENGLLAPVEDAAALASQMKRVLSDTALRKKITLSGIERANDFSAPKISKEYLQSIISV